MPVTSEGLSLELDGQPVTLRYTLGASKKVCATFGGYREAFQALFKFDPVAFNTIVAAGLDKEPKDIEEAVFRAGYDSLFKDLSEYLGWLSNGGKKPGPVATGGADSGNA